MADIKIKTQTLVDTAEKVRSINRTLTEKLDEISATMLSLQNSSWRSDAATETYETMKAKKPKFDLYNGIVEEYAKFLDRTAQSYESTETGVLTNAQDFR